MLSSRYIKLCFLCQHGYTFALTVASEKQGNFMVWSSTPEMEPIVLSISSFFTIGVVVKG